MCPALPCLPHYQDGTAVITGSARPPTTKPKQLPVQAQHPNGSNWGLSPGLGSLPAPITSTRPCATLP